MKKVPAVILGVFVCALAAASYAQQATMSTYQLVILTKGPNYRAPSDPEAQKLFKQHVDFLYKQAATGVFKAAGPFGDGGDIQGVIIVSAPTPDVARQIEAEDPAVKAGVFAVEVLPFMAEATFGKWAEFPNFEHVFFGFLVTGPDRTQDKETAADLQKQHIAYMTTQHLQGKLAVAGPFTQAGRHRGIVIYRVTDPAEAKRRANGDPMVKAGRLAVELHPWQVPVGALPK